MFQIVFCWLALNLFMGKLSGHFISKVKQGPVDFTRANVIFPWCLDSDFFRVHPKDYACISVVHACVWFQNYALLIVNL